MLSKKLIPILILASLSLLITAKKVCYSSYMKPDQVMNQLENDDRKLTSAIANTRTEVASTVKQLEQQLIQLSQEHTALKEEVKQIKQELLRLFKHAGISPWMNLY